MVTIGCTKKYTVSDTNYGISLSNFEMGVRQNYAHGRDYQNEVPYLNILNRWYLLLPGWMCEKKTASKYSYMLVGNWKIWYFTWDHPWNTGLHLSGNKHVKDLWFLSVMVEAWAIYWGVSRVCGAGLLKTAHTPFVLFVEPSNTRANLFCGWNVKTKYQGIYYIQIYIYNQLHPTNIKSSVLSNTTLVDQRRRNIGNLQIMCNIRHNNNFIENICITYWFLIKEKTEKPIFCC